MGEISIEEALAQELPENRARLRAQFRAALRERNEERKFVARQLRHTNNIPDSVYKYLPLNLIGKNKFPMSLRATQPSAMNDVMEANVTTMKNDRTMDGATWGTKLSAELARVGFPLAEDDLTQRLNLYGDVRIPTEIQDYLAEHLGVVSFSADPLMQTMWANYAGKSGFVVGYDSESLAGMGN